MNDDRADRIALGKRIKEEREYRGFSQEEVARHLGVSRSAISLIETGSRRVTARELSRLAMLYQITMESLAGRDEGSAEPESVRLVARAAAQLSPQDRAEVLRFAEFLRARKSDDPA